MQRPAHDQPGEPSEVRREAVRRHAGLLLGLTLSGGVVLLALGWLVLVRRRARQRPMRGDAPTRRLDAWAEAGRRASPVSVRELEDDRLDNDDTRAPFDEPGGSP